MNEHELLVERALWKFKMRSGESMLYGDLALTKRAAEQALVALRYAVILAEANGVRCG